MITRPLVEADQAFVFDSWLRSFRASHESGPYAPDLYFPAARGTIERLLSRPEVQALVIEDETASVLIGWLVHEPHWYRWSRRLRRLEDFHIVHYCFVREGDVDARVRGRGFAKYLLDTAGVRRNSSSTAYSFSTPAARGLLGEAARFIPDAARFASRPTREPS